MQLTICIALRQKFQVRRNHFHRQTMAIECSVVEHHLFLPTNAVKNHARPGNSSYRKSGSQGLAENTDIGTNAVVLLAASGRVAEAGDHLVEDEQDIILLSQLAELLQVSISRRNTAHVGH